MINSSRLLVYHLRKSLYGRYLTYVVVIVASASEIRPGMRRLFEKVRKCAKTVPKVWGRSEALTIRGYRLFRVTNEQMVLGRIMPNVKPIKLRSTYLLPR